MKVIGEFKRYNIIDVITSKSTTLFNCEISIKIHAERGSRNVIIDKPMTATTLLPLSESTMPKEQ
jgi:hypothetical protein